MRPAQPEQNTTIGGRYRIEGRLGSGGAAQLYRVLDVMGGRVLALKLLRRDAPAALRELFELEYQTLASLTHPRTPEVFEFGSDAFGPYYTMELLQGRDLSTLAPLPWREVCSQLRDASQALGLLHARKLLHRDVSPRNLWRTPDGRVKLIDFGALAPFGAHTKLIGTPPLISPEAHEGWALDQRADLYALGGVSYFLLTGGHAFPARTIAELPSFWGGRLRRPSQLVAELARPELEPVPAELDRLVLALLSADPLVRPSSTAEVIDRIDALCGTTLESPREAAAARLTNVAYVGRTRERRKLTRRLALAARGRGRALVIESAAGVGRSRVLRELELTAAVAHAKVLHVDAAAEGGQLGVVSALALALLDAFPERARSLASAHAALLAHLSARVCERLAVAAAPGSENPGELRVRVQNAACAWFLALAAERTLVVLVDGLEHADDASVAFLIELALAAPRAQLLLVGALLQDRARERSAALRALLKVAQVSLLPPLTAAEMHALLQSVFGPNEHLSRLSARLFELSAGNPGHALALGRELIDRGEISFEGGSWVLPRELDARSLSSSRAQAVAARLMRVGGPARELARLLSVHDGPLTPGLCRALALCVGGDLLPHLGELIAEEILVATGPSLMFAHAELRGMCLGELPTAALRSARLALAEQLVAAADAGAIEHLQAGVHWLEAEDPRGPAAVVRASLTLLQHEVDKLPSAAAWIERALTVFRARGFPAYAQASLLTALTAAGFEGELRYVARYGEDAVRTLEALLELPRARRLRRTVGGKASLAAAFGLAALQLRRLRRDPTAPDFMTALQMFALAVPTAAAASSLCMDTACVARVAETLRPLDALGPKELGTVLYELCQAILSSARERSVEKLARWRALHARCADPALFARVTPDQAQRCRGGVLIGLATVELLRDAPDALRYADALDQNGLQLDLVHADQIRAAYYGQRGDVVAYERYKQRAEHRAIARGSSWQLEVWSIGVATVIALHLHDALAMKHASEQLRRLNEHMPSILPHARFAHGAYLILHGKHEEALPWLEFCLDEVPCARPGWARTHGMLARAYNRLGDHARASAACARVFEHMAAEELAFPHMTLIVELERAIAEAGLGRLAEADAQLTQLHARFATSENRLLRGQVHETALEIALQTGDLAAAREALLRVEQLYRPLLIPSLAQHCEALSVRVRALDARFSVAPLPAAAVANDLDDELSADPLFTAVPTLPLTAAAERALILLAQHVGATLGALYLADAASAPRLLASLSTQAPSPLIQRWAEERLMREREDDGPATVTTSEADGGPAFWNTMREGRNAHRLVPLATGQGQTVGLAIMGRAGDAPKECSRALTAAIARRLSEAAAEESSAHADRTGSS